MDQKATIESHLVMIHNPNEYNLRFRYPTDNVLVHDFHHWHIINDLTWFLSEVRNMATDDRTLLVLFGLYQNHQETSDWLYKIDDFYKSVPNPMVFFSGRLTTQQPEIVQNLSFPFHRLLMFDRISVVNWFHGLACRDRLHEFDWSFHDRKYKAYWASSRDSYPRRYLLSLLVQHGILPYCQINYKCLHTEFRTFEQDANQGAGFPERFMSHEDWPKYHQIYQECVKISHMLPLPALDNTIEFSQTEPEMYRDSYTGIVIDTVYDSPDVFLSEKIFNAIINEQIFFYMGPPGTLAHLKKLGYETYSDIIDESYDEIQNHADRLIAGADSIINFLKQSTDEIKAAYDKVWPKIQHNKHWLMKQRPDLKYTELCQQAIHKK